MPTKYGAYNCILLDTYKEKMKAITPNLKELKLKKIQWLFFLLVITSITELEFVKLEYPHPHMEAMSRPTTMCSRPPD